MARVKRAVHARKKHKAILEKAKGYYGDRSRTFRSANEQVLHSGQYAFRDRRAKKGEFRSLWIQRINAGCRLHDMSLQPIHCWFVKGGHCCRSKDLGRPCSAR